MSRQVLVRTATGVAVLVVLGAAVYAWVTAPTLYEQVRDEGARTQAVVTTRASVLAALAGIGALVTIAINYRNSAIAHRNAEIAAQTLATTNQTFRLTARGHFTDRYATAIGQLGDKDSLAIRLGGIYALQQFALETDRTEDQTTVVEVLSAFVRTGLPRRAVHATTDSDEGSHKFGDEPDARVLEPVEPPPDVLAAISTLAQLPNRVDLRADFSGADFTGVQIGHARLRGAVLRGVELRAVVLSGAVLCGADLRDATLSGADLSGADLSGADCTGAVLRGAVFRGAAVRGTALRDADLRGAVFRAADLTATDLGGADLRNAVLRSAVLGEGVLVNANMRGAELSGADLRDADLSGAALSRAVLNGADLRGATLAGAVVRGADFSGARVDPGQLSPEQQSLVHTWPGEQTAHRA